MKKQLHSKTTSPSDKQPTPLTDRFARKYFEICKVLGKELNGIERAKFLMSLKRNNLEEILEILEMMDTYEKGRESAIKSHGHTIAPQVVDQGPPNNWGGVNYTIEGKTDPNMSSSGPLPGTTFWISDGTG